MADSEAKALDYASANSRLPNAPPRIDYSVLALASVQTGLALLACVPAIFTRRGYYETDAMNWRTRAAWRLTDTDPHVIGWFLVSALILFGATRFPGYRRAWYLSGLLILAIQLIVWLSALANLEGARFNYRWISTYYGTPEPQGWNSFAPEQSLYWQGPIMLAIVNPACLLLAVRSLRSAARTAAPMK